MISLPAGFHLGAGSGYDGTMASPDPYRIGTVEELRALVGESSPAVAAKLGTALDEHARAFIARSPFLVLATSDARGPRRTCRRRVTIRASSRSRTSGPCSFPTAPATSSSSACRTSSPTRTSASSSWFPGTGETLRVNGTAELTRDPAILERLTARGKPALLAIRVTVEECFFHCAKAFLRARLWKPETWAPLQVSFGRMLAPKLSAEKDATEPLAQAIDQMIAEDYRTNL